MAFSKRLMSSSLRRPSGNDVGRKFNGELSMGGGAADTGENGEEYTGGVARTGIRRADVGESGVSFELGVVAGGVEGEDGVDRVGGVENRNMIYRARYSSSYLRINFWCSCISIGCNVNGGMSTCITSMRCSFHNISVSSDPD